MPRSRLLYEKKESFFRILLLGCLTVLGPFFIDMYLPSFSAIARDMNTTPAKVAMSLSSFFIGLVAGQLLYGPLLDRFGRKKPLYIDLLIYIAALISCLGVHSVDHMIVLRFIQAVGSCAATVASTAMVRDLFSVEENAKVFSLLMAVIGVSSLLAPATGNTLTSFFGWQSIFIMLAGIALSALLTGWLGFAGNLIFFYIYELSGIYNI